jgi:hypothetical protein
VFVEKDYSTGGKEEEKVNKPLKRYFHSGMEYAII